jgi:hypothetical protein
MYYDEWRYITQFKLHRKEIKTLEIRQDLQKKKQTSIVSFRMRIAGTYNGYRVSCSGIPPPYSYHREAHKDDTDQREIYLHFFLLNRHRG